MQIIKANIVTNNRHNLIPNAIRTWKEWDDSTSVSISSTTFEQTNILIRMMRTLINWVFCQFWVSAHIHEWKQLKLESNVYGWCVIFSTNYIQNQNNTLNLLKFSFNWTYLLSPCQQTNHNQASLKLANTSTHVFKSIRNWYLYRFKVFLLNV